MATADLHVHSRYSDHPSEWFLQRLGARECYSDPEEVYRAAKAKGMTFVTLTDHNCITGALQLVAAHPDDTFVSVEVTAYFPEDGCKVHILVFGLDEEQFQQIEALRRNIYDLSLYLHEERLAHSVAHATYAVNGRLTVEHIERLLLLFDCFEVINGTRPRSNNEAVTQVLAALDELRLSALESVYGIEPVVDDPWRKSVTAGSDDHAGIFIADAHTVVAGETVEEFLGSLRVAGGVPVGVHNDFRGLAFAIYRIANEFTKERGASGTRSLFSQLGDLVFEKSTPSLGRRLAIATAGSRDTSDGMLAAGYARLVEALRRNDDAPMRERLDIVYDSISDVCDRFIASVIESLKTDILRGDLSGLLRSCSSMLPVAFLVAPFFSALKHVSGNRALVAELDARYGHPDVSREPRVLWFTDTLGDLNGVSTTLAGVTRAAGERGSGITLVTCLSPDRRASTEVLGGLNLEPVSSFRLPVYDHYDLGIPSILSSLRLLHDLDPDKIIISTPGPVGALGMLCAKLLSLPCTLVYHTDFAEEHRHIVPDSDGTTDLIESAQRWFYGLADEVLVPTDAYIQLLASRGYETSRMRRFERGVDMLLFSPRPGARRLLAMRVRAEIDGFVIAYSGRLAADKRVGFVLDIAERLEAEGVEVSVLVAGDGPDADAVAARLAALRRGIFLGRLDYDRMPEVYSAADVLICPSTIDTFGMVVIEAQACGTPVLVSDQGGPKELVSDGQSGWVLPADDIDRWVDRVRECIRERGQDDVQWLLRCSSARHHVQVNHSIDRMLDEFVQPARKADEVTCARGVA